MLDGEKRPAYKSYCWSLGTTSFRTRNLNLTIERQLQLIDEFWRKPENLNARWSGNADLQAAYYLFLRDRGFLRGDAPRQEKDAREKTSGLRDIGLLDGGRRLMEAGKDLAEISRNGVFARDNDLQLPRDSYLYFKQLLKTHCEVNGWVVRPFLVLTYLLSRLDHLTMEEYTYLLPLCISREITESMAENIPALRRGELRVEDVILSVLLSMENYRAALAELLQAPDVDEFLLCRVGLNRKSRLYDKAYYPLYTALCRIRRWSGPTRRRRFAPHFSGPCICSRPRPHSATIWT